MTRICVPLTGSTICLERSTQGSVPIVVIQHVDPYPPSIDSMHVAHTLTGALLDSAGREQYRSSTANDFMGSSVP